MAFLDSIRLAPKLLAIPLVLSLSLAGVGWFAHHSLTTIEQGTETTYKDQVLPLYDLAAVTEAFQRSRANLIESLYLPDPDARKASRTKAATRIAETRAALAAFTATVHEEHERVAVAELTTAMARFADGATTLLASLDRDDQAAAEATWFKTCEPARTDVQKAMDAVYAAAQAHALTDVTEAREQLASSVTVMSTVTVLAIVTCLSVGWFVVRGLAGRARELAIAARQVATGAPAMLHVAGKDELADVADAFRSVIDAHAELTAAATLVAAGDTSISVTSRGPEDELALAFTSLIETTRSLTDDLGALVRAAQAGNLRSRADASRFSGGFAEIIEGVNRLLDATAAPIDEAATVLERVAARDLTARMDGAYQGDFARIKVSINSAVGTLEGSLRQVASAAGEVTAAAGMIASSSQNVAQGASEQAVALQGAASSLESLSAATGQNADNAAQAHLLVQQAAAASDHGIAAMAGMSDAMQNIRGSAERTAAIIRDINDVAFQTNLLALNAAVEAARAGDAGRGFAVVAEEVRSLAQRAKEAARKTETLIQESVELARSGEGMSRQVCGNLEEIAKAVGGVQAIVGEIAAASAGQAMGITGVTGSVSGMDHVTQQNAASSEETAAAVEELSGQAIELANMVGQFRISDVQTARAPTKRGRGSPQGLALAG